MRCNDLQDQINAFAAGDLAPVRAWRLRRHLAVCAVCNGRLLRARRMNLGLADLGVAPPSDPLRQRVFADLDFLASRVANEEMVWHDRERARRRKRLQAFAGAFAALTFTGVVGVPVAQLVWPQSRVVRFTDTAGREWQLSGTFTGIVDLVDAQGRSLTNGTMMINLGEEPGGTLVIDVVGEHFQAIGYGDHPLRNARGESFGTVFLNSGGKSLFVPQSTRINTQGTAPALVMRFAPELQDATKAATRAYPWGAVGIDRTIGVIWRMHGRGRVQALKPGDSEPLTTAETGPLTPKIRARLSPELRAAADRAVPEFEWTVHDQGGRATGYGTHELRDEKGKLVLILKADRLPQ